jgi:hypothetical protein
MEDEMNRTSLRISTCLLAIVAASCSASSKKIDLGGHCVQNSDCNNPLACKFQACHQQCVQSRDCPIGQQCVAADDGSGVCQTQAEAACGAANGLACGSPLVCVNSTCVNVCTSIGTCTLPHQTCIGGAVCVDNTALASDGGTACALNSDCANPLVCQMGSCRQECTSSASCASGGHCVIVDGVPVCLTPQESAACGGGGICASPLVCNPVDNTCRAACTSGCLGSQTCVGTVCVDNTELAGNPGYDGSAGAGGGADAGSAGAGGGSSGGSDAGVDVPVTSPGDAAAGSGGSGGSAGGATSSGGVAGAAGSPTGGAGGRAGSGGQTGSSCPSPQTQFGFIAQGDSNSNFQSGLGVRTADELLIFNGYLGPDPMPTADAGSPPDAHYVYVQAFDPATGQSKGPARPFFKAGDFPTNRDIALETAAIAPTGEIILLFYIAGSGGVTGMSAAFLSKSITDAGVGGLQVGRIVQVEVAQLGSQPDCIWSVASKAFVCSWRYGTSNGNWPVKVRKFLPDGRSAGGDTDEVPTDRPDNLTRSYGEVGASGNLFGVGYIGYSDIFPRLTVMDKLGNQVGSTIELQQTANSNWVTVAGTSAGFVTFCDQAGVAETLVPVDSSGNVAAATGADAGVLSGFHFTGTKPANTGRAINDDVGGVGGVGLALFYDDGVAFAYVNADGLTHVGPGTAIPHSYSTGDYINITNFAGSFGVSLYSAAAHSTQMAATGCTH